MARQIAEAFAAFLHVSVPVIGDAINWVTDKTVSLARSIANAMEDTFAGNHSKAAGFFGQNSKTNEWTNHLVRRNAISTNRLGQFITTVKLPKLQKNATEAATAAALAKAGKLTPLGARARYQAAQAETALETKFKGAILRDITHDPAFRNAIAADVPLGRALPGVRGGYTKAEIDARIREYVKAAISAAGLAIPFPIPGKPLSIPKKQAKENTETNKRLKRLEKILGASGFAALLTATLGGEITRFLKCKNTRGIAKAWCGANLKALLGLLTGLLAAVGVFSLIDFAHYIEDGIEDGAKLVLHFWSKDVASGIDQSFGDGGVAAKRDPSFGSA